MDPTKEDPLMKSTLSVVDGLGISQIKPIFLWSASESVMAGQINFLC